MSIKAWFLVHKWTSLICTLFLLMLCLTGLPLIFHEEIDYLFGDELEAPAMPANTPDGMSTTRIWRLSAWPAAWMRPGMRTVHW